MSPTNKVHIVRTVEGDWEAFYFNGMKLLEGHSVPVTDVLETLRIPWEVSTVDLEEMPDIWPDDEGA